MYAVCVICGKEFVVGEEGIVVGDFAICSECLMEIQEEIENLDFKFAC